MKGIKIGLDVVKALVILITSILAIMIASNWDSAMEESGWLYVLNNEPSVASPLGGILTIFWILLIICVVAAVVFGIWAVVQNPKKNVRALIGIGLVVLIGLISYYGLADTTLPSKLSVDEMPTDSMVKTVTSGITMFYILGFLAIGALLYLEVSKIFK